MRLVTVLALAATLLASPLAARAQNLLTNGSLESPTSGGYDLIPGGSNFVTGWTTLLNGVERFAPPLSGVGAARDGALVMDICPLTFTGGGMQQTFATTPGEAYRLAFSAGTSNAFGRNGTALVEVLVGSEARNLALTNFSPIVAWNDIVVDFVADAPTTTLTFRNTQDSNVHFAFIDAVSVTAATVPEPGTLGLLASAALGLFLVRRRRTSSPGTR